MSTQHDSDRHIGAEDSFDRAMRGLHAQALTSVSAAMQARLRMARTAATAPSRSAAHESTWVGSRWAGSNWVWASGLAAMFALVIGLQFNAAPTATPAGPALAGTATGSDVGALAALDENPEFYLWLASNDDAMPASWER